MKNKKIICLIIVLTLVFVLCLLNHYQGHDWGGDFSLYIHQTKSIIEGKIDDLALKNKFIVENSSVNTFSPILYPWGVSVLYLPVYYVFELNIKVFKILETLLLVMALLFVFRLFTYKKRLSFLYGLLLIGIIGFNFVFINHTNYILSEIPFILFSFFGIYLILKYLDSPLNSTWKSVFVVGVTLFICFSIRTEGIGLTFSLFAGQLQYMINQKGYLKKISFKLFLPYLVFFCLYFITSRWLFPSGFTHHFSYRELVSWDRSLNNIQTYFNFLKTELFFIPIIPYFVYLVISFLVIGLISRLKYDFVLISNFLFFITLFIIYPFPYSRYLYVVYPFILYFFIQGLLSIKKIFKKNDLVIYFVLFILGLHLTTNIIFTIKETKKSIETPLETVYGPEILESKEVFSFIKENTEETSIIAFFRPRVMHLYTNRVSLALFNSLKEIKEKADYYVETKQVGTYFQIPIDIQYNGTSSDFKKIFSNKEFNVYKVIK